MDNIDIAIDADDDSYIARLKEIRKIKEWLIDKVAANNNDIYATKLKTVSQEEQLLVNRLIEERLYLAEAFRLDPLTGLYNRKILSKVRDIGTVIMFDIDDFKTINDTFGHAVGDQALQAVGKSILDNIRIGDIGCRFGGDEFLIIFTTDKKEVIESRMKKIVEDTNSIFPLPDYKITMSIGITFNKDKESLQTLMDKADKALYCSKQNGKDQMTYYGELQKPKELIKKED